MASNHHGRSMNLLLPAGVFIFSIFVIALFWVVLPGGFDISGNVDYTNYYQPAARDILAGRGYKFMKGFFVISYPPGYPVILAGVFGLSNLLNIPEEAALLAFILLCMGLASVLLFLLARSVWGSLPALVSVLIWITCPFTLWLTEQPNSEIPFLVVFYGSFYLLWYGIRRKGQAWFIYFLSGLLAGFASLIRPLVVGIGLIMGVIIWVVKRGMKARIRVFLITVLLLGNLVAVLPWEMWVYSKINRVVLLTTAGGANIRDGLTLTRPKEFRKEVTLPHDVAVLMNDICAHSRQMKYFGNISRYLIKELRRRPLAVTKLFVIKAARSWYGTDSNRFETPIMFIQFVYLVLIAWSTMAVWKLGGIGRELTVSIWLVVLYFWAVTTIGLSILRYMVPVMGLLFILAPGLFLKYYSSKSRTIV